MRITLATLLFLALTTVTAGQDSFTLRQQYGEPDVERFEIRPDMNATVVYAPNGDAQSLIIEPRQAFIHADFSRRPMITLETALDIVHELVPETRGKPLSNLGEMQASCGAAVSGALGDVKISHSFNACMDPIGVQGLSVSFPSNSTGPQSANDFRGRYAEPDAERFVIKRNPSDPKGNKQDITLMVEYGSDREACRMRVEPRHDFGRTLPANKSVAVGEFMSVLDDLVPSAVRGEELGTMKPMGAGCHPAPVPTEYENVVVNPYVLCERPPAVIGMEIHFKRPVCEELPGYSVPLN